MTNITPEALAVELVGAISNPKSVDDFKAKAAAYVKAKGFSVVDAEGNEIDATLVIGAAAPSEEDMAKADDEPAKDDEEQQSNIELIVKALESSNRRAERVTDAKIKAMSVTGGNTRNDDKAKAGFKSFGEFAATVHRHAMGEATKDDISHLKSVLTLETKGSTAPDAYSQTGVGADGGFLVPQDFRTEISRYSFGDESLFARTTQIPVNGNSLTLPKDETTPWGSDGVQVYWTGEGQQIQESKLKIGEADIKLHKLAALVPVTNELLEDAAISLDAYLNQVAPEKIRFKVDDAIINGNGVGKPLGIRNSGALKTITRTTATGISTPEIAGLLAGTTGSSMMKGVYVGHSTILPDLVTATIGDTPIFTPPGGLKDAPFGALLGRPIIYHELAQARDTAGDLSYYDLSQYISVVKTGGVRSDVSMHLYFDRDITAFRFILRVGGQPWMAAPITQNNGGGTLSPFVTVGAS